ncbi:MAG: hypothetical protein IJT01_03505 [Selenomonadaceae bacterium]|nr:hypothetical protein [Selenomonadaceae bacterium]
MKSKSLERFYRELLSVDWEARLRAYSAIEQDLKMRGCYELNDDRWEDMKLLVGQVISIHFKKHVPRDLEDFKEKLSQLYLRLIGPLRMDRSIGYLDSMQLLIDIYDDDDHAARDDIHRFFSTQGMRGPREDETVLGNLFRCYELMMQQVKDRSACATI